MSNISKLAHIHPNAKLGNNVTIEPFAFIDDNVEIGDNTIIMSGANVRAFSRIGSGCKVFPGAVIGGIPQDLKFRGEETYTIVGNNTTIRECATINRGTAAKEKTVVGDNCLLMAYTHIAHDCVINNNVIISNATQIAGEVVVEHHAILSAEVLVHQFTHIGSYVMIQGGSKVGKDIPPFTMVGRDPLCFCGINSVGLRRNNFSNEKINQIQEIYRIIYQSGHNVTDAVKIIESQFESTPELQLICNFIKTSERGIIRGNLE